MPKFFSPSGNPEVWGSRPDGYLTPGEWAEAHPAPEPPEPTQEEAREARRRELLSALAELDTKYLTPRTLAGLASGDSYARAQAAEHESRAAVFRTALAGL
jgi:hypothetical protein